MKAFALPLPLLAVLGALMLAACQPAPPPPVVEVPPGIDPLTGQPVDLTPGLNDREPDTCHGAEQALLIGQPEAAVAMAGITGPVRVIPLGGIVSQEEYDAFRINFHLDGVGNIARITCG
ncbi:MAG TPA: I78 family peptidase inhibitor [Paracoccaceae bacterium]